MRWGLGRGLGRYRGGGRGGGGGAVGGEGEEDYKCAPYGQGQQ